MIGKVEKFESDVVFLGWDTELFQGAVLPSDYNILIICVLILLLQLLAHLDLISDFKLDWSERLVSIYCLNFLVDKMSDRSLSTHDDDHTVHGKPLKDQRLTVKTSL